MRRKREIQEINASSMADIAFLLLTFFLVTTSMVTDKGLARQLPPPVPDGLEAKDIDVKKRNILIIVIDGDNRLTVNNEITDVRQLKNKVKEFIANKNNDPDLPEKTTEKVPFLGEYPTTKSHIISLQSDRKTEYQAYISVQNELMTAYRELRDELSRSKFGTSFAELDVERKKAIQKVYPQNISEAEPKSYGGTE